MDDQGSTQYKRSCLFNKFMRVSPLISTSVSRETILIECKVELQALKAEISRLRPTGAKLLSKAVEDLQVMLNVHSVKLWGDGYRSKRLALEDVLRVSVGKTSAGPINGVRTTLKWVPGVTYLMMVFSNRFFRTLPSSFIVKVTENVRRSCPGTKLQICSLNAGGSIGTARWMR